MLLSTWIAEVEFFLMYSCIVHLVDWTSYLFLCSRCFNWGENATESFVEFLIVIVETSPLIFSL